MNSSGTQVRNRILYDIYQYGFKPLAFRCDPERVHDTMTRLGNFLGSYSGTRHLIRSMFTYRDPILTQNIAGLTFKNPIGLAAGFDKNAELTSIIPEVGFGFEEVGSVTGQPCIGNPKPRLWRLPDHKSLVVYYGLKNDGCDSIVARFAHTSFQIPVGFSIAMTNCTCNLNLTAAIDDYCHAFATVEPIAGYITVNISCPNTQGGQPFLVPENFNQLFNRLDAIPTNKQIFIKLSPDLGLTQIDELLDKARNHRIHGIICTNLTKQRGRALRGRSDIPQVGGFSGKIVQGISDEMIKHIYTRERGRYILIGCGGVFSAQDAYRKIRNGASLVQLITGMIYEGPQLISEINRELAGMLRKDGFARIQDAVGVDCKALE